MLAHSYSKFYHTFTLRKIASINLVQEFETHHLWEFARRREGHMGRERESRAEHLTIYVAISSGASPSRSNLNVTILWLWVSSWHSTILSPVSHTCYREYNNRNFKKIKNTILMPLKELSTLTETCQIILGFLMSRPALMSWPNNPKLHKSLYFWQLASTHHVWTLFICLAVSSRLTLIMVSLGLLILSWRERVRDVLRLGFRTRDSLRALPEPSFPSLISLPNVASEFILQKSRDPITEVCNSESMRDEMDTALIYEQRNTPVTRGPSWCCLFIRNMLLKCTEDNEFNANGTWFQQRFTCC